MSATPNRLANSDDHQRGDTLVEIVVALAILGVTCVAVMGAMTSTVVGSGVGASAATSESAVRAAAEQQLLAKTYVRCTTSSLPTYAFIAPTGFTATAVTVEFWNGTFGGGGFQASCPARDRGIQRLTVTITNSSGRPTPAQVAVVLRDANP